KPPPLPSTPEHIGRPALTRPLSLDACLRRHDTPWFQPPPSNGYTPGRSVQRREFTACGGNPAFSQKEQSASASSAAEVFRRPAESGRLRASSRLGVCGITFLHGDRTMATRITRRNLLMSGAAA